MVSVAASNKRRETTKTFCASEKGSVRDIGNSVCQTKQSPKAAGQWTTQSCLSSHVRICYMRWQLGSDIMYGLWYFHSIAYEISLSEISVLVDSFYYCTGQEVTTLNTVASLLLSSLYVFSPFCWSLVVSSICNFLQVKSCVYCLY